MIERVTAQSGDEVLRVGGRLMASRIDPRAEARAWVDARLALLNDVRTVVVLGLGSGYHVTELVKRTSARILVLEPRADVIAAWDEDFARDRVRVEHTEDLASLRTSDDVRRALATSYLTMVHPASRGLSPEFYRDAVAHLNARAPGHLAWVWELKNLGTLPEELTRGDAALSIHDLAQIELTADAGEREHLLIKALRELVK